MKIFSNIEDILQKKGIVESGWLEVSTRSDGSPYGIPMNVLCGKEPGPTFLVEACCHGDETEGTLAAVTLVKELEAGSIKGKVIVVPALNTRAYESSTRGNPDERYNYDMNRLFPGNPNGSVSQKIVHAYVSKVVTKADYVVSLHGGGNLFYLANRVMVSKDPKSIELAKAMGPEWKYLHQSHHPGTLLVECADRGIPCVIAELGGSSNRLPDAIMKNVLAFVEAVKNIMRSVGVLEGDATCPDQWGILEGTNVRCKYGGIMIPTEKCRIHNEVKKGDHMVTVYNLFGNELEKVLAPQDGMVLGVPVLPLAYPGNNILTIARVAEWIE
jgi:predicted deacylase